MPIIYNQFKGQKAVISVTGTTETFTTANLVQSSTDQSNRISYDSVSNFVVNKIFWSGPVTISRGIASGANVIFSTNDVHTGTWALDTFGITLATNPTANLTIVAAANTTCIVEVKKTWIGNTAY